MLGAGAEGQAAERADGAVVRGDGDKFQQSWKSARTSGGARAGRRQRACAATRLHRVRLGSFLTGRARAGRTARLCPTQDRQIWPLKMAILSWVPGAGAAQRLRCSIYPQFRVWVVYSQNGWGGRTPRPGLCAKSPDLAGFELSQAVQVGGTGAGGWGWCRWTGLAQVDGAGAGGRGWCRWAGAGGLVLVGRLTRVCADVCDMRGC